MAAIITIASIFFTIIPVVHLTIIDEETSI